MSAPADKAQEHTSESVAGEVFQRAGAQAAVSAFEDNRPEALAQRKLQQAAANSPRVRQLKGIQQRVAAGPPPALRAPAATGESAQGQQAHAGGEQAARPAAAATRANAVQQAGAAPVQRLKWSEVYTGNPKETIGISEKQMPESVEAVTGDKATEDRNVWAGQTKKGRSGFLWHKEGTLEVQYDIKAMQQYRIIDANAVFYTAVRQAAVAPIRQHGIDPNYGNAEKPDGSTQYNTRGFNYFGKDRKIPNIYGAQYLAPEPWTVLSFKLPEGTLIERDPEIPNGLRTTYHIKPGDLAS